MYDMGCNNCLQEIISGEDFYEDEAEGTKYHVNCKKAAIDRRDKAEARVAELQAEFDVALDRVGELQAELAAHRAAHRWRPVTEDWPHYHDRVVIAHWGGTWAQFARRVQSDDGEDEWLLDDGRKFDFESASVALLTSPPPLPAPDANEEPTS